MISFLSSARKVWNSNAKRDTANAELRIQELRSTIAEANTKALEASEAADRERLARVKLEQEVAPRRVTTTQVAIVKEQFQDKPCSINVLWVDNPEAIIFAQDLVTVFSAAGCQVSHQGQNVIHGPPFFGLRVVPPDSQIERALAAANIPFEEGVLPPPLHTHLDQFTQATKLIFMSVSVHRRCKMPKSDDVGEDFRRTRNSVVES